MSAVTYPTRVTGRTTSEDKLSSDRTRTMTTRSVKWGCLWGTLLCHGPLEVHLEVKAALHSDQVADHMLHRPIETLHLRTSSFHDTTLQPHCRVAVWTKNLVRLWRLAGLYQSCILFAPFQ